MKKNNILNLRIIIFFISIIISWVQADEIRVPNFSWEKIDVIFNRGDDLPEGRRDYAIGYGRDKNEVIIFGGRTFDNKVLGDTWIFNIDQKMWRKPLLANRETDVQPPGRYGMVYGNDQPASNSFRNAFVITGGKGSDSKIYNDVWSFDFINECWVEINAKGDKPEPRYDAVGGINLTLVSHLNQLSSIYLILSHGRNDSKHFSDTYILKLDGRSQQGDYSLLSAEWKKLNTKNAPVLKDGSTGNVLSDDRLVVYGGCENVNNKISCDGKGYFLNIDFDYLKTEVTGEPVWQEVPNECIRPKGYAASSRGSDQSLTDLYYNDRLIIFGGDTEAKYGTDADGDISIFDMDKRKFFGVHPSSKNNNQYPKATKGGKMVTTYPRIGEKGFSIILLGGEPFTEGENWYSDIWRLSISDDDYNYYPDAPAGNTITDCYTIKDVKEDSIVINSNSKETIPSFILFILGYMVGIPALVISSRALNCFTHKWKRLFFSKGIISLIMIILDFILSFDPKNVAVFILKIIVLCFLLIYLILPFFRPKQPSIDPNQIEVNAAGIPIVSMKEKTKRDDDRHPKELNNATSTTVLVSSSAKDKTNTAATEINVNFENDSYNVPTQSSTSILQVHNSNDGDNNNNTNNNNNTTTTNNNNKSILPSAMINPSLKETLEEDDEVNGDDDDSYVSDIEDEDEVIKKKYLSRAKCWLMILRSFGVILLIGAFATVLLLAFNKDSRLSKVKILVFIWIALVILLFIISIFIARKRHASMALLKARRTSFRRNEPLEPNPLPSSWTIPITLPLPGDISEISANASVSVYDDIGNISCYSANAKPNTSVNTVPQLPSSTNVPVVGGTASNTRYSFPPLPVNNIYLNNQGQFSVQPNFNTPSQTPTINSSLMNQPLDSTVYKTSEIIQQPSLSYSSSVDPLVTTLPSDEQVVASSSRTAPKLSSNSHYSLRSLTNNNMNPPTQDQVYNDNGQYVPSLPVIAPSSPLLDESIQIDMEGTGEGRVGEAGSIDEFPQRSETIENMNDKEVMMVMTVPKRKLAVVNM